MAALRLEMEKRRATNTYSGLPVLYLSLARSLLIVSSACMILSSLSPVFDHLSLSLSLCRSTLPIIPPPSFDSRLFIPSPDPSTFQRSPAQFIRSIYYRRVALLSLFYRRILAL